MKKSILITALLFLTLTACNESDDSASNLPPPPPPEPPAIVEPAPPANPRIIFVYDPAAPEIGTSDGLYYYQLATEKAANAHQGRISIGDILHSIDNTGTSLSTQRLPIIPDKIAISGPDVWCFKIIFDAISGRYYTMIYLNSTQYGRWTDNEWTISEAIVTARGDIIALDTGGRYRNILDPTMTVNYASQDGILIHSIDVANHRANIDDTRVAFSTNYFFSAKQWVEAGGVYYSWNGYTWDGTTFTELSTKLHEFVTLWYSERPVIVPVGSRIEHSEAVTYWVECNTGWLYRHTPSINRLENVVQLYRGDGTRNSGLLVRNEIKPILTAHNIYYGWNDSVWSYSFVSSLVSSFGAGVDIWGI